MPLVFRLLQFFLSPQSLVLDPTGIMGRLSRTIYVGNLPGDIREREVEDLFYKYGHIVEIDLKVPPRPPGYAFVEFEDSRDADDAIRGRDGYDFDGHRLRVELAHGGQGSSSYDRHSSYSSGSRGGVSRRSNHRVLISGLPSSASWQDLKDHMRRAGDVCFSQVFRDRDGLRGIVDYTNYEDMKYAIRKLDDSLFRNQFSRSYIRVEEYDKRRSYSRSPSPYYSRGRSYSRSRSPRRSYSSQSRSVSPRGKYSRRSASVSRSRSFSPVRSFSRLPVAVVNYFDCGRGSSMDSFGSKVVLKPFGYRILLILTRIVSGIFADLSHDPDLHCHLNIVGSMQGAQAGVGAGASLILVHRGVPTETFQETTGRPKPNSVVPCRLVGCLGNWLLA